MAETGKHPDSRLSVLFIVRGDETVPSCRFRAFQYREPLREIGVEAGYVILERSKNPFRQFLFHLKLIPALKKHRVVIFQKLLEPWRLIFLKAFNRNLYYDFDDAMYAAKDGARFPATVRAAPGFSATESTATASMIPRLGCASRAGNAPSGRHSVKRTSLGPTASTRPRRPP